MKIAIIGSGNVATQLGKAFRNAGHKIIFVYSRNLKHAEKLAGELKSESGNNFKELAPSRADVFIVAATRTPFGRYGGRLAALRCDDLAAAPITSLMARYPTVDWGAVDEVVLGCANQAGEDNRNVARMATLLSGLPETVPAV